MIRTIAMTISCLLAGLLLGSPAIAANNESITISVDLPISGEPTSVMGIALGPTLEMISAVSLKRFSASTLTATFVVPEKASAALAMAEMPDGTTVFGDTRLVSSARSIPSLASVPECPIIGTIKADPSQRGLMQSLVEIRTARKDVLKNKLKDILSGPTLEKARKLEQLFGLARPQALSADLLPSEVIDRLSRLTAAIKSYRDARMSRESASNMNNAKATR